jgi:short-subunit dehydrogenase
MATETVLITGASSGIGRDLATLFAADKSNLVLVARSTDKLEEAAQQLRQEYGVTVHVQVQDLAQPAAPRQLCEQLTAQGITVDVLVNNAGFGALGAFADLALERQLAMIQVNITALVELTGLLLPGMRQHGRGGILNVGSTAGFQPGPIMAVYYASKAFVNHFSEALAEELVGSGVTVTCLAPGATATDFARVAHMENARLFKGSAVMDSRTVAEAGYRAFRRGQVLVVTGLRNKLMAFAVRFGPRSLVRKIAGRFQKVRMQKQQE